MFTNKQYIQYKAIRSSLKFHKYQLEGSLNCGRLREKIIVDGEVLIWLNGRRRSFALHTTTILQGKLHRLCTFPPPAIGPRILVRLGKHCKVVAVAAASVGNRDAEGGG